MLVFIQMLLGSILASLPAILAKIGIGVVAYKGIDLIVSAVKADALSKIGGLDSSTLALVGVLQIGTGINILCSAVLVKFAIQGFTAAGGLKRFGAK